MDHFVAVSEVDPGGNRKEGGETRVKIDCKNKTKF